MSLMNLGYHYLDGNCALNFKEYSFCEDGPICVVFVLPIFAPQIGLPRLAHRGILGLI